MKNDLVSVVVPIYNVEKYLNRCVESIVAQTYTNLEILLIDDGSSDHCPRLCEAWAKRDSRIQVIHKENAGLGMARNTGITHATGEYICYIDSDDFIDRNTIALAHDALVKHRADLAVFGHSKYFEDGRTVGSDIRLEKSVFTEEAVTRELLPWFIQSNRRKEPDCPFAFSAWSGLLRRRVLEENRIRFLSEREVISEDTLYLLELYSKLQRVVLIPKRLYYYCVNPTSLTNTYREDRREKNRVFLQYAQALAVKAGYSTEVQHRILMLYHGFSVEAMKHIVRLPVTDQEKRSLLAAFFSDRELHNAITWGAVTRSGVFMAIFLVFIRWKLQSFCFLLLRLREKMRKP